MGGIQQHEGHLAQGKGQRPEVPLQNGRLVVGYFRMSFCDVGLSALVPTFAHVPDTAARSNPVALWTFRDFGGACVAQQRTPSASANRTVANAKDKLKRKRTSCTKKETGTAMAKCGRGWRQGHTADLAPKAGRWPCS